MVVKFRVRLVVDSKHCCLKWCENCVLKNVVEIRVFSVHKTKRKKSFLYHGLNNMFQYSKNINMCLVYVCCI